MPKKPTIAQIRKEKSPEKKKNDTPKRAITLSDLIKFIGVLAVFIPLMNAILQYRLSIQNEMDENFRVIVDKLSSKDIESRLAAASSLGTFITKGKKYYDEAIDLLMNRLSIELDQNVLNAIRGSLEKIRGKQEYRKVIEKLLSTNRYLATRTHVLDEQLESAENAYSLSKNRYTEMTNQIGNYKSEDASVILDNLIKDMDAKRKLYYEREKVTGELEFHHQVIYGFISGFLRFKKYQEIENIIFFINRLEDVNLVDLNLSKSEIKYSLLAKSIIWHTKFNGSFISYTNFEEIFFSNTTFIDCEITQSIFILSNLTNVDFSGSVFRDVFFTGSDLTGTRFNNVTGLKPIHFYKTKNLNKAIFDPAFKKELDMKLGSITEEEFKEFINNNPELKTAGLRFSLKSALTGIPGLIRE